ncbi:MAG: FAD-dependent oxidoreductase, partial [Chloroflexota bacterium]
HTDKAGANREINQGNWRFKMAENIATRYLIIGNSAGGISAAAAIREVDQTGRITIVSDEPYAVYSRPLIADYLAGKRGIDDISYRAAGLHEGDNILTLSGKHAVKLDSAGHQVSLANGDSITWEKLLLATGGVPIVPAMPGRERKGVFTFTTLDNARNIRSYLDHEMNGIMREQVVVVIGGGLIGMSVSEALTECGIRVVVVEMKDYLLNTILDAESGGIAAAAVKSAGVRIVTGHTVSVINGETDGAVSSVTLDDGSRISCRMVVVAIGVRPNTALVAGTAIKTDRGILVDRHMATSIPGIYACGDVAQAYDFVLGSERLSPVWPNACLGGRTAGLNMAGMDVAYPGGTPMNSIKYFGLEMATAGVVNPADDSYEIVKGTGKNVFRKLVLKEGRICGMVFAGNVEKCGVIFGLMKDKAVVSGYQGLLVAEELNMAALPEEIWQTKIRLPA